MKLPLPAAFGLMVLAVGSASAQTPPTEYTLKLSPQALVLVAKGLQELPYKDAAVVLQAIQQQVDEQMKAQKEPPK